jgi:hypothetical protein
MEGSGVGGGGLLMKEEEEGRWRPEGRKTRAARGRTINT